MSDDKQPKKDTSSEESNGTVEQCEEAFPTIGRRPRKRYQGKPSYANIGIWMPEWLADEAVEYTEDDPDSNAHPNLVFPEEAIQAKGTDGDDPKYIPYIPVIDGLNEGSTPEDYQNVFGRFFQPTAGNSFDDYIGGLLDLIRNYNASLYWLRLHHLRTKNILGDFNDLPEIPISGGETKKPSDIVEPKPGIPDIIKPAEEDFHKCVCLLRTKIGEGFHGNKVIIDAIRVNGYVLSVRIIAGPEIVNNAGDIKPEEIGGSSSSYCCISSPFSSSGG